MGTVDEMGRLYLPRLSRAALGIGPGDWVEFWIGPDRLALRKVAADLAGATNRPAEVHDAGAAESENQDGT